jgi:hypothetical protein
MQVEVEAALILLAREVQAVLGAEEQEQQVQVLRVMVLPILVQAEEVLHKHLVQMTAEMAALA